jgi:hypothetical protein
MSIPNKTNRIQGFKSSRILLLSHYGIAYNVRVCNHATFYPNVH